MLPLRQMLRPGETMIYTYPTEAFMLCIRIALIAGLFIAAPLIFWQVWLFVAPALYAKERRYAIPFVVLSSIGVIAGAAFSHYVAFPLMWRFFASFSNDLVVVHAAHRGRVQPLHADAARHGGRLSDAGDGVLSGADGRGHRALDDPPVQVRGARHRGVAAIITPSSDVASQLIVAGPMVVLYVLSIGIAWIVREEATARRLTDRFYILGSRFSVRSFATADVDHVLRLHFHHLLRPAIAQLDDAVLQAFRADRQAQRHAQQIGVLELDARAQPVAVVVKHLEPAASSSASIRLATAAISGLVESRLTRCTWYGATGHGQMMPSAS